ncbi:MAG: hypothetical protein E7361_03860 [Clostridiales bacterium]|nr:hypothetical protein [Clostridiales bacterium]
MKVKSKAVYIAIIAVLALALIGMAVGLVLVAKNVATNNSMTIRYEVTGASCDITASGINYENDGIVDKSDIYVRESENETPTQTSITKEIKFGNTAGGSFIFSSADKSATPLTAAGRAAYFFQIENTANATSERMLQAKAVITNPTEANNIKIHLGLSESAVEITEETSTATFNIGTGGETATIVVILEVDDDTVGASYNCEFDLEIGYELGDITNMEDANSATTAASADDIKNEVESYSTLAATRYYDTNGNAVSSASEAAVKVESYPTVDIYYGDVATSNAISANSNSISAIPSSPTGHKVTNKRYIKLTEDIDYSQLVSETINNVASIILDGNGKTITIDGSYLPAENEYYIFKELYDSTIKNLTIELVGEIGGIVNMPKGTVVFENVKVVSKDNDFVNITADTNLSAFCRSIKSAGLEHNVIFRNCENSAKLIGQVDYFGLFVGGYPRTNGHIEFDNCKFSGEVYAMNSCGVLFGNPSYKPGNGYTVNNFVSTGTIHYMPNSAGTNTPHILASNTGSTSLTKNFPEYPNYDQTYTDNNVTIATINEGWLGTISSLDCTTAGNDLVLETNNLNDSYLVQLGSFFYHKDYDEGVEETKRIMLSIDLTHTGTTTTFEDILLPLIDKQSYIDMGKTVSNNPNDWTTMSEASYKYIKTADAYVIDTNGEYLFDEVMNTRASMMVFAKDSSGKITGISNDNTPYLAYINIHAGNTDGIGLEITNGSGTICMNPSVDHFWPYANFYYYNTGNTNGVIGNFTLKLSTDRSYRVIVNYTDASGTAQSVSKVLSGNVSLTDIIGVQDLSGISGKIQINIYK